MNAHGGEGEVERSVKAHPRFHVPEVGREKQQPRAGTTNVGSCSSTLSSRASRVCGCRPSSAATTTCRKTAPSMNRTRSTTGIVCIKIEYYGIPHFMYLTPFRSSSPSSGSIARGPRTLG